MTNRHFCPNRRAEVASVFTETLLRVQQKKRHFTELVRAPLLSPRVDQNSSRRRLFDVLVCVHLRNAFLFLVLLLGAKATLVAQLDKGKPAAMTHSGFFDRAMLPPSVARSYDGEQDATGIHPRQGSPAGGLQASTGDLNLLVQAINTGKLLKPDSVTTLRSLIPHPPGAPPPADPTRLMAYGIEGGAPGVNAQLVIDPGGRYVRVILCNGSPPMGATIRGWIERMTSASKSPES